MKKRNILVSFLLALALMITACGEASPFIGKWRGTCDLTDVILGQSEWASSEELSDYIDEVDGLEFVICFEFTENEMSMYVDESSIDSFIRNTETSMKNMMEAYIIDQLSVSGLSYEEYLAERGVDSDELLQGMLDEMDMTVQIEEMMNAMADALKLSGTYMYDDEKLTVVYEDNTFEELDYTLDESGLTIVFVDAQGTEFPITCELQK